MSMDQDIEHETQLETQGSAYFLIEAPSDLLSKLHNEIDEGLNQQLNEQLNIDRQAISCFFFHQSDFWPKQLAYNITRLIYLIGHLLGQPGLRSHTRYRTAR